VRGQSVLCRCKKQKNKSDSGEIDKALPHFNYHPGIRRDAAPSDSVAESLAVED
jgi:hypothetical protein